MYFLHELQNACTESLVSSLFNFSMHDLCVEILYHHLAFVLAVLWSIIVYNTVLQNSSASFKFIHAIAIMH